MPPTQVDIAGHTVVQVPQCVVLVLVSTQRAGTPQLVRPPPHVVHEPPTHVPPVPQLMPQPPQFIGSVLVLTHCVPQNI
jgi:hypothetical protein